MTRSDWIKEAGNIGIAFQDIDSMSDEQLEERVTWAKQRIAEAQKLSEILNKRYPKMTGYKTGKNGKIRVNLGTYYKTVGYRDEILKGEQ